MKNINNEEPRYCAIYCRVSTTEQAEEGYSIAEQERLLREFSDQNNCIVYNVYSDAGISGKDIKHRPAIQELLNDAVNKKFQMVISWKINRLSRKLSDAIQIVETLEKYGITYRSYSEPFESDTPAGRMQFQMMALIGEFERGTISQNVKMGMIAKARAGEWCGGSAPLGYKWIPMETKTNATRKKSMLAIDEKEAYIVKEIFEMYAQGKGYKAIVNCINKKGYRTKKGRTFAVGQIRTILLNPVYIGKVRFNVRRDWNEKRRNNINPDPVLADGIHEAIIDQELWNRVQSLFHQKSGKPSRLYSGEYPLTGIMKCPVCGAGMVLSRTTNVLKDGTRKQLTYYSCGAWKNQGTAVCNSNSIRVEKANEVVFAELEKVLTNEKFLHAIVNKVNAENHRTICVTDKKLCQLNKELLEQQQKSEKLYNAFMEGVFSNAEYTVRKNEINNRIEIIQSQMNEEKAQSNNQIVQEIPYELVREILANFHKVLHSDSIDRTLKKQLLHMLISEITLDKRREVDSIKIRLTEEIIKFLDNGDGTLVNSVPSFIMFKNIGYQAIDFQLAI